MSRYSQRKGKHLRLVTKVRSIFRSFLGRDKIKIIIERRKKKKTEKEPKNEI